MYRKYFNEVWELHQKWALGVLYREICQTKSANIILSEIGGEFYNFAYPTVLSPEEFETDELEKILTEHKEKPVVMLLAEHQDHGFIEQLVRKGYSFLTSDTWVGYDKDTYKDAPIKADIVTVTPKHFADYDAVLGTVFADWPGNDTYNEICRKTVSGEIKGEFPGLKSELYVIYDNGKPAAGAGLFFSKERNVAYLHDAGTLEAYRGKGYQSDLIRHRVKVALENGIDRIYSSVDRGEQSWSNMLKIGFNEMHTSLFLVKK